MNVFSLKYRDTYPILEVTLLKPDKAPVDLTGATSLKLFIKLSDGSRLARTMTVFGAPTQGVLRYAWVAGDWAAPSIPDSDGAYTVGGLVVGPTLPLTPGVHEHRMEYEVVWGTARLTLPNDGTSAGDAYDTLRVWSDIGQG